MDLVIFVQNGLQIISSSEGKFPYFRVAPQFFDTKKIFLNLFKEKNQNSDLWLKIEEKHANFWFFRIDSKCFKNVIQNENLNF